MSTEENVSQKVQNQLSWFLLVSVHSFHSNWRNEQKQLLWENKGMIVGFLDAVEILLFPCSDTNNAAKCSASPCLTKAMLNKHGVIPHFDYRHFRLFIVTIFSQADLTYISSFHTSGKSRTLRFLISLGFQSLYPFPYHLIPSTVEYDKALPNSFPATLCSPGSSF